MSEHPIIVAEGLTSLGYLRWQCPRERCGMFHTAPRVRFGSRESCGRHGTFTVIAEEDLHRRMGRSA